LNGRRLRLDAGRLSDVAATVVFRRDGRWLAAGERRGEITLAPCSAFSDPSFSTHPQVTADSSPPPASPYF